VKVKLFLPLIKHQAMKTYSESGGIAPRPCRFTPRVTAPGIHCIGGWVGPRHCLDAVSERKKNPTIDPAGN
jgi:hypothetical protein